MKKKLAKIIGSILLSSMVLASVCPLSALAADEPASEPNVTDTPAVVQQEQQIDQIALAESEPIVTGAQTSAETLKNDSPDDPETITVKEEESENKEETEVGKDPQADDTEEDADLNESNEEALEETPEGETKQAPVVAAANDKRMDLKATAKGAQEDRIELTITNNTGMFKADAAYLETKNGKTELVMALSSTGYQYLFLGTYEEASAVGYDTSAWIKFFTDENGKYAFRIPLEEGKTYYPLVAISQSFLELYLQKKNSLERAFYPRQFVVDIQAKTLMTGDYEFSRPLTVENSEEMLEISKASLETVGGPNSNNYRSDLSITLGNDVFDKVFVGTAEAAAKAKEVIEAEEDLKEKTFLIPVRWVKTFGQPETMETLLDEPFITAFHSIQDDSWYEWKFEVKEEESTLTIGEPTEEDKEKEKEKEEQGGGSAITPGGEGQNQYDDPLNGGTAAVDNTTTLADGDYTPDSFSFSGGTGKVNITCSQITVTNGQAYATIIFSSPNYGYVKAAGNTYYPTVTGGQSIFTIPVQLNQNNTIIGMTTAMSAAHEITYTIFVYLAAAEGKEASGSTSTIGEENKLDEEAPTIEGLGDGEEIKLENAELLKLFSYGEGVTLVEIVRTSDADSDSEMNPADAQEDDADQEAVVTNEEEGASSDIKTDADYRMELYKAAVVKYLVIKEGTVIPAGLEKKVIVIRVPKSAAYVSSETIAAKLEALNTLDSVTAVGVKEDECTDDALKTAYSENQIVFGGALNDLNYTELVKRKTDIVIGESEEILVKEAEKDQTDADYREQYAKLSERMALLDIPLIIDRSADETGTKGQLEWLKLYGILFGKETEADALIAKGN